MGLLTDLIVHLALLAYVIQSLSHRWRGWRRGSSPRLHPECGHCGADLSDCLGIGGLTGKSCPDFGQQLTLVGVRPPNVPDLWNQRRSQLVRRITLSIVVAGYFGYLAIRLVQHAPQPEMMALASLLVILVGVTCLLVIASSSIQLHKHYQLLRYR